MKKIFSIMMLCLCCMAFVSCETSEGEYTGNKFAACAFVAMPSYGLDIFGFYDITVTYTAIDGTVQELKADEEGSFIAKDASYKLPATVKYVVKAVKKSTFDEYKASKSSFDVRIMAPGYIAGWVTQDGTETFARQSTQFVGSKNLSVEKIDEYFSNETVQKKLNYTFEGTYVKTDNGGCNFEVKE